MTSPTGNKNRSCGFTLIEVMATAAILALGTVAVFQSNLTNLNVYGRYVNRLAVQNWADEKIWAAKESLLGDDFSQTGETAGTVRIRAKDYHWVLKTEENPSNDIGSRKLYEITLDVSWSDGGRDFNFARSSFLLKAKQ